MTNPRSLSSFSPGEKWSYSTAGYYYVQAVIEELAGVPFASTMQTEVLTPLGMTSSSFVWDDRFEDCVAQGHLADGLPQAFRKFSVADADSLLTTASDYGRLVAHILNPYGPLNAASEMLEEQIRMDDCLSWALGWGLQSTPDGECFWHLGGGEGSPSQNLVLAFSELGCGIVLLTNGEMGHCLFEEVVSIALGGSYPIFPWDQFYTKHFGS